MMEEPVELLRPRVHSPCSSGKRRSCDSNSPEFEFWSMLRNPSFPQPNLLSADELFADGVLLPLHLLHNHSSDDPLDQNPPEKPAEPETSGSDHPGSGPEISSALSDSSASAFTSSKRWKDIFKITDRSSSKEKEKEKKKEKKIGGGGGGGGNNNGVSAAELNINIWPFRSRSAGNGGSRPRMAAAGATRKVSSAPCSRSNSAGESKSRKWPSSPNRGGVHLGRTSPVWQVRRGAGGSGGGKGGAGDPGARNVEKGSKKGVNEVRRKTSAANVSGRGAAGAGAKAKILHLNVPMCIGYRHHLSCRSDENGGVSVVTEATVVGGGGVGVGGVHRGGPAGADEGVRGTNLFNIRSLFTKKVH